MKKRILLNIFLCFFSIGCIYLFVSFDSDMLNSFFLDYNNVFAINEIDTGMGADKANFLSVRQVGYDKWVFPVNGNYTITTSYSYGHKALDIYSYSGHGSDIVAANNGVVTSVKSGCVVGNLSCNGRGGNYVVIKHNTGNYYTVYMHLASINVSVGEKVYSGSKIGTMGNTGNVIPVPTSSNPYAGTHLHYCLYVGEPFRGGYAINPNSVY